MKGGEWIGIPARDFYFNEIAVHQHTLASENARRKEEFQGELWNQ